MKLALALTTVIGALLTGLAGSAVASGAVNSSAPQPIAHPSPSQPQVELLHERFGEPV
jgi:hypothetical protein